MNSQFEVEIQVQVRLAGLGEELTRATQERDMIGCYHLSSNVVETTPDIEISKYQYASYF